MSRPRAVEVGVELIRTLHDPGARGRLDRLRALLADGATWWVDTGRDRAAGVHDHDPGDARPWPLHGTMPVEDKLALVGRLAPRAFPGGVAARITRAFGTDQVGVVEAEGDGEHVSGTRYRNRYAFVFDVSDDGITSIREYLDTLHAEDVFGGDRQSVRSIAPPPRQPEPPIAATTPAEERALALWPLLAAGEIEGFGACFAPGGTWWTDTGTDRDLGDFGRLNRADGGYPLHGVVPIGDKLASMRRRLVEGYAGTIEVTPTRVVSEGGLVLVEAEGAARLADGLEYRNRYAFVVAVGEDGIEQVREYCDTLHVVDVTGASGPGTESTRGRGEGWHGS